MTIYNMFNALENALRTRHLLDEVVYGLVYEGQFGSTSSTCFSK